MELQDHLYEDIVRFCSEGDQLVDESEYDKAVEKYLKALDLIPEPKVIWEASKWVYSALGDTYFFIKDCEKAKHFFYKALNCSDGTNNPFILLRLGEILYELQQTNKAKEYLHRAYLLEGEKIFEDENDKYFLLILDLI